MKKVQDAANGITRRAVCCEIDRDGAMNGRFVAGESRMTMRTGPFACIVIVLLSAMAIPAAAEGQAEIDGVYTSRGTNPDGSEYQGIVHLLRKGDRFIVAWMSPRTAGEAVLLELTSVGVGIRSGETLAVSYVAGNSLGVVVYQIGIDGQLVGRWTTDGDSEVHAETLTKLPARVPSEPATADPADTPAAPPRRTPRPSAGTISL